MICLGTIDGGPTAVVQTSNEYEYEEAKVVPDSPL